MPVDLAAMRQETAVVVGPQVRIEMLDPFRRAGHDDGAAAVADHGTFEHDREDVLQRLAGLMVKPDLGHGPAAHPSSSSFPNRFQARHPKAGIPFAMPGGYLSDHDPTAYCRL